jgi:YVTN family beta-propeller protein
MTSTSKKTASTRHLGVVRGAALTATSALIGCGLVLGGGLAANAAPAQDSAFGQAAVAAAEIGAPSITLSPTTVTTDGGSITIQGTGMDPTDRAWFAVKLDDGGNSWKSPQPTGELVGKGGSNYIQVPGSVIDANGEFTIAVAVPDGLSVGEHSVRILGGVGGGGAYSQSAEFDVVQATADKTVTPGTVSTAADGKVSVPVTGQNFTEGAKVTASLDGQALQFKAGRAAATDDLTVGADGTFSSTVVVPTGSALVGSEHTLTITSDKDGVSQVTFTADPSISTTLSTPAQGASGDVTIGNLPVGAKVTGIGAADQNWLGDGQNGEVAEGENAVTISDVSIPEDAEVGAVIIVTYTIAGTTTDFDTGQIVTPNNALVNTDQYEATSKTLPQGLYQIASNPSTNSLFVTYAASVSSGLLELDATTLEQKALGAAPIVDGETSSIYGVGADNTRKLVWATNTRSNGVTVYDQNDLSAAPVYIDGNTGHARDVVVDESTGLAYVSSSTGSVIGVYDGNTKTHLKDITLGTDEEPFTGVMSLDLDQSTGKLYTVSLQNARAAVIDTRNGDQATYFDLGDDVSRASGAAYDPTTHNLFVASQGSSNVVVLNTISGKVIANIPAGAGALNVTYDPVHRLVYSANRTSGTVTVIDAETLQRVANLDGGQNPNQVKVVNGTAYMVNKAASDNAIYTYTPKAEAKGDPAAPTADALTDENVGDIMLDASTVKPGATVTVSGLDALEGQQVDAYLFSDTVQASDDATVTDGKITVTVPEDFAAGDHKLAIANTYGTVQGWAALTVATDGDGENGDSENGGGTDGGTETGDTSDGATDDGATDGGTETGETDVQADQTTDEATLARTGMESTALVLAGGAAAAIAAGMILAAVRRMRHQD